MFSLLPEILKSHRLVLAYYLITSFISVQLAKGAFYTGAKLMMKRLGIAKLDRVILAGAFGSYIDKTEAMFLGMFPNCDLDRVSSVGNGAGDGARIALLNRNKRLEAETAARQVEYLELTLEKAFQQEFMAAMFIPHMLDPFPHLPPLGGNIKKPSPG